MYITGVMSKDDRVRLHESYLRAMLMQGIYLAPMYVAQVIRDASRRYSPAGIFARDIRERFAGGTCLGRPPPPSLFPRPIVPLPEDGRPPPSTCAPLRSPGDDGYALVRIIMAR
jgi:hypothetical protein